MAKKDNTVGLSFKADVVDLKNGLKQIKDEISKADKEFQLNTASMQKWSDNTDGLTAKLQQLNTKLSSQKKTVDLYKQAIEEASAKEGDHSKEIENLRKKLVDAEIAVSRTEKEINHYSDSLSDVSKKEQEANSELGKLTKTISEQEAELKDLGDEYKNAVITYGKNSKEAKSLKGEINKLSDEIENNKKQVQFADKQLELLDDQFDETADSAEQFSKGLDGIKDLGSKVAGGVAAISAGVGALAGAFLATAGESKEFRTNMGKLETGFETSGLKAEQAAETYKNLFAVVADEGKATEATAMIGQMAKSQEDLNKWVNISTGVYATFGDSLPIESLAEAAMETSKTGQLTGGLADALNWAGKSEEEFQASLDACTTEQERQKLITDTLNGVYDEASKKYQQVNEDVIESNKAQVELSETMAEFGEKAEPILTALKEGFNVILQEVLKLTEDVDFNALAEKIKEGFSYFVDVIVPAIKDGFQWILDNKDILIAGIAAIGTAMLAWNVVSIVQGVVGAIKGWQAATTGMTTAQALLNAVMMANPIGLIVAAVAGLTAGFIILWNKCDAFRQFWIDLWEGIKTAVGTAVDWVKENWEALALFLINPMAGVFKYLYDNFDGFREKVDSVVSSVVQFFKNCWAGVQDAWSGAKDWFSDIATKVSDAFKNIPTKIKEFFSNAWTKVKEAWSSTKDFFSGIKDTVINTFKELPSKMLDVGEDLVKGLWNGINDMASWVSNKIKGFTGDILSGIKNFFGIHSPSTEMAEVGKYLDEGLVQGIEEGKDDVVKTATDLGSELVDAIAQADGKEGVKSIIDGLADATNKTKIFGAAAEKATFKKTEESLNNVKTMLGELRVGAEVEKIESAYERTARAAKDFANSLDIASSHNVLEKLKKDSDGFVRNLADSLVSYGELLVLGKSKSNLSSFELSMKEIGLDSAIQQIDELKELFVDAVKNPELKKGIEDLVEDFKSMSMYLNVDALAEFAKDYDVSFEELLFGNSDNDFDGAWEMLFNGMPEAAKNAAEATTDTLSEIDKWLTTTAGSVLNNINNQFNLYFDKSKEMFSSLTELSNQLIENEQNALDAELEKFNKVKDAEIARIDELVAANKMSEEEATKAKEKAEAEKLKMEEETLRKKNELAERQFNAQKASNIAMTLANGAAAIVKGFAELGPVAGAINAGIQAVTTAAQIATISAQQYVPMLAKGGIVDSPTFAMIGEAGKEVVMPLENNTGWISELAYKLKDFMQKDFSFMTPQPQLAYAGTPVVNNYNNYNQTINSPKQLSRREIYRNSKNLLSLKG